MNIEAMNITELRREFFECEYSLGNGDLLERARDRMNELDPDRYYVIAEMRNDDVTSFLSPMLTIMEGEKKPALIYLLKGDGNHRFPDAGRKVKIDYGQNDIVIAEIEKSWLRPRGSDELHYDKYSDRFCRVTIKLPNGCRLTVDFNTIL